MLNGEALIYDKNENSPIGIGTSGGSNTDQNKFLSDGSIYYAQVVGISSIKLYDNLIDFNAGTNPVGFTTINTQGTHKFKTLEKKNFLRSVLIEDAGTNYTNRKLSVKPDGISSIEYTIYFENHGFLDGEVVTYNYEYGGTAISGISSANQYKVIKLDDNTFRIANAGIGATNDSDYNRGDYVKFTSSGTGFQ